MEIEYKKNYRPGTNSRGLMPETPPVVVVDMKDPHFLSSCERAGVEPTRRQARKFLRGIGAAAKVA